MQVGVGEEEKQAFLAAAEGRLGGGHQIVYMPLPLSWSKSGRRNRSPRAGGWVTIATAIAAPVPGLLFTHTQMCEGKTRYWLCKLEQPKLDAEFS